jgi:hypothetical protein
MKKTLLFSAVMIFSAGAFAQTSVKNSAAVKHQTSVESNKDGSHVNTAADASSAASIHSDRVNKANNKSRSEIKKERKALAAENRAQAAEAENKGRKISRIASGQSGSASGSSKGELISGIASEGRSGSASAHSKTNTDVAAEHNNLSDNTSLSSSAVIKRSRKQIKNKEKENREAASNASVKSSNHVNAHLNKKAVKANKKINATSANVVEAAHAVQPKPVSIKTGAQVRTNAAIKIR